MTKIFIGVITPNGSPRNPMLISQLWSFSAEITIAGVATSEIVLTSNSELLPAEIACKRSHELMYKNAVNDYKWALILEDDAEFDANKLRALWELIGEIDKKTPLIVSCYLGEWSVVRTSKEYKGALQPIYPPDGALCYFINSEAMKLALQSFEYVRPADWPIWSKDVEFLIFPGIARELASSISLIDPMKTRVKAARTITEKVNVFLGVAYFKNLGIRWTTVKSIWYWVYRERMLWYFPLLAKAKRSNKLSENL
jgi:GR25 family glycosyltransferase involved in LPS biosynthesis